MKGHHKRILGNRFYDMPFLLILLQIFQWHGAPPQLTLHKVSVKASNPTTLMLIPSVGPSTAKLLSESNVTSFSEIKGIGQKREKTLNLFLTP
jgi:hypothetical protein